MIFKDIEKVKELLENKKNIVILTHLNPDGDAIGSSLALYQYLAQKHHFVNVITPDNYPDFLCWMPDNKKITIFNRNIEKASDLIKKADIIFCLDFNSLSRIDKAKDIFIQSKAFKIHIDHHVEPEKFSDVLFSDVNTSSTSELIYDFINELGDITLINKEMAENLFVGIMTDTGSYSYACNYDKTFNITAELIKKGVDVEKIHRLVYDTYSEQRMKLLGYCLSEKMKIIPEYKTAIISLSKSELKQFNHKIGDTEGIVNFPLSIKSVMISVLFHEREDLVKLSFRSKDNYAVNKIAKEFFNGGGHKNAAGGNFNLSLEDTIKYFENKLPEFYKTICNNINNQD